MLFSTKLYTKDFDLWCKLPIVTFESNKESRVFGEMFTQLNTMSFKYTYHVHLSLQKPKQQNTIS